MFCPVSFLWWGVQDVFDEAGNCTDASTDERIRALAGNLMEYTHKYLCPRQCMEAVSREA